MFYVIQPKWPSRAKSPANENTRNPKAPTAEETNDKSLEFAREKTTEYIRNARQVHFQERRMFF
ncbi:MAG: hypothetical protein KME64_43545 [Scytonematopsis contorta HA4267-MV1]|jgi:hypothetical protein|nr:hypothetical protein [Scytonematopsis contorta HA4267-MV1]